MVRGFNAQEDYFEVFLLIAAAHGISGSSILNQFVEEYVKTHYDSIMRFSGVKEAAQEFDPNYDFDKFVRRVAKMKLRQRFVRSHKKTNKHRRYIKTAGTADICDREDVNHENY